MAIQTGRQFPLPQGSTLAFFGTGSGHGLTMIYMVELRGEASTVENRRHWEALRKVMLLYLHVGAQKRYALRAGDAHIQTIYPYAGSHGHWLRMMFETNGADVINHVSYGRELAKFLTQCWPVTDWVEMRSRAEERASAKDCPLDPRDFAVAVDTIGNIAPIEYGWYVQRVLQAAVKAQGWEVSLEINSKRGREAHAWLVEHGYLLQEERRWVCTRKFVLACFDQATELVKVS